MIVLTGSADKLFSRSEIFENVHKHIIDNRVDAEGISIISVALAIALNEDVDFVRRAIS